MQNFNILIIRHCLMSLVLFVAINNSLKAQWVYKSKINPKSEPVNMPKASGRITVNDTSYYYTPLNVADRYNSPDTLIDLGELALYSDANSIPRDFGALTVTNPLSWQTGRMTVRLEMRWGSVYSTCSGILISPGKVLTAGHCIYNHENNRGLADDVIVEAAYHDGYAPYATAVATGVVQWSGWTEYENYDYDLAILHLDRHLGVRAGFARPNYELTNNELRTLNFEHHSYPGESDFGYDGHDQYRALGNFDYTSTHLVGHHRYVYRGMSGSVVVRPQGNGRYPAAVASHFRSNSDGERVENNYVRLSGSKYDAILSAYLSDFYGADDLIPTEAIITTSSTPQIGWFVDATANFSLYNRSRDNQFNNLRVDFYLSRDRIFDESDTWVDYTQINSTIIETNSTREFTAPLSIVTWELDEGCYYVFTRLSNGDDYPFNNDLELSPLFDQQICFDPAPYCESSDFYEDSGLFDDGSPANSSYGRNSNCSFAIWDTLGNGTIELNFPESDQLGVNDFIRIYDGSLTNINEVYTLTGRIDPNTVIRTNTGLLLIHFYSDDYDDGNLGWTAEYQIQRSSSRRQSEGELILYENPVQHGTLVYEYRPEQENQNSLPYILVALNTGRIALEGRTNNWTIERLDLSNLEPGIYLFQLETAEGLFQRRIVVP